MWTLCSRADYKQKNLTQKQHNKKSTQAQKIYLNRNDNITLKSNKIKTILPKRPELYRYQYLLLKINTFPQHWTFCYFLFGMFFSSCNALSLPHLITAKWLNPPGFKTI